MGSIFDDPQIVPFRKRLDRRHVHHRATHVDGDNADGLEWFVQRQASLFELLKLVLRIR